MLLADKRELQNNLKVSLLQIEEKELNYYTTNCMTVGTQAAMLGGFAFAALMKVETADTHAGKSFVEIFREDALCFVWYISAVLGMLLETFALVKSMQLSILAPGLALRGSKEGSMTQALVTMRTEYHRVHMCFYSGLFCFLISVALFAVAFFTHVAAGYLSITVCFIIVSGVLWLYNDYRKVSLKLALPNAAERGVVWDAEERTVSYERSPSPLSGRAAFRKSEGASSSSKGARNTTVVVQRVSRSSKKSGKQAIKDGELPGQPVIDRRAQHAAARELVSETRNQGSYFQQESW